MTRPIALLLFLFAMASLSACGQKGPLYLPDNQSASPASATPAE